ncbi:hypothetical protein SLEP1_g55560 [Rubroshorea leprosula]|uniref:Secreted protein n=1 Tax=Rubroshorea leprosula TaxID=152421 RepID=A0AAV5MFV2_9ROSI|nr:hypothetical protein SLEP1_g55560 [Rubroshorea leprosula]
MQICSAVVALFCAATFFDVVEAIAGQWRKGRKMSGEWLERVVDDGGWGQRGRWRKEICSVSVFLSLNSFYFLHSICSCY